MTQPPPPPGMPPGGMPPGPQGMPPQFGHAPYPPQPPRKKKKSALPFVLLGVGLLLVLVVGGAITGFVLSSGSGGNSEGLGEIDTGDEVMTGQIGWRVGGGSQPTGQAKLNPLDTAFADGVVLRLTQTQLLAVSAEKGEKLWEIPAPPAPGAPSSAFCGLSGNASNGTIAVGYGRLRQNPYMPSASSQECTSVQLLDIKTGQPKWNYTLPDQISPDDAMTVEFIGNTVVAADKNGAQGLNPQDGRPVWNYKPQDYCNLNQAKPGAQSLVVVEECRENEPDQMFVQDVDAATGQVKSKAPMTPGLDEVKILSTNPIVVEEVPEGDFTDPPPGRFVFFDETGRERASLGTRGPYGDISQEPLGQGMNADNRAEFPVVSGHGLLVVPNAPRDVAQNHRQTNEFVAIDVNTGQVKWTKSLGPKNNGRVFAVVPDGFLAINEGTYEMPPRPVKVAAADGAMSALGQPYPRNEVNPVSDYDLYFANNTIYGVSAVSSYDDIVALR